MFQVETFRYINYEMHSALILLEIKHLFQPKVFLMNASQLRPYVPFAYAMTFIYSLMEAAEHIALDVYFCLMGAEFFLTRAFKIIYWLLLN